MVLWVSCHFNRSWEKKWRKVIFIIFWERKSREEVRSVDEEWYFVFKWCKWCDVSWGALLQCYNLPPPPTPSIYQSMSGPELSFISLIYIRIFYGTENWTTPDLKNVNTIKSTSWTGKNEELNNKVFFLMILFYNFIIVFRNIQIILSSNHHCTSPAASILTVIGLQD